MISIPTGAKKIIQVLHENAHDAYVVGGCVRDSILGRDPGDWDITTSARPRDVKRLFRRTVDTGIEHGTVTILMDDGDYEVTTYRIDGKYTDARHPDSVEYTDDLTEDLRRRDFTINAMAYSDEKGLVDVYGGLEDLSAHLIRCVGDPNARFTEDALRILRAVRFAAQLGFTIEEYTSAAIKNHVPQLAHVSKERILAELNKSLLSEHPDALKLIFTENMEHSISDSFALIREEATEGMDQAAFLRKERYLRWAALMREISPEDAEKILRELKCDVDTIHKVRTLVGVLKDRTPVRPVEIRRLLSKIGPDLFEDMVALKRFGFGRYAREDCDRALTEFYRILERGDAYSIKMLKVRGEDLIAAGVKPGPNMGEMLNRMLDAVIEEPEMNTKEELMKLV
jgi:tRNA nucleotidyltransferase (CCA-adding enzyme)